MVVTHPAAAFLFLAAILSLSSSIPHDPVACLACKPAKSSEVASTFLPSPSVKHHQCTLAPSPREYRQPQPMPHPWPGDTECWTWMRNPTCPMCSDTGCWNSWERLSLSLISAIIRRPVLVKHELWMGLTSSEISFTGLCLRRPGGPAAKAHFEIKRFPAEDQ